MINLLEAFGAFMWVFCCCAVDSAEPYNLVACFGALLGLALLAMCERYNRDEY